jgi:GGDEF domain-containing protein
LDDIEAVRDSGGTDLADAVLISVAEAMKTAAADERVMSVLSEETEMELQQTISTMRLIGP